MRKIPLLAAAAALSLFAIAPASATVAGGGLPILTNASDSGVQLAAMRRWYGNGRSGGDWGHGGNWHHHNNDHGWDNGGVAFGFGMPSYGYGYPDNGYGYEDQYDTGYAVQGMGDQHVQYCMSRYRTYDPDSDTFVGYDGMRHRCNAY